MDSQKKFNPSFSLEFFPPKTEKGAENLRNTRNEHAELKPAYISVTFGAGGSTQEGTIETGTEIKKATRFLFFNKALTHLKEFLRLFDK